MTSTTTRAAARAHYASLVAAYPALLWLGRDMWFRLDEWRIVLGHAGSGPHFWDVFAPFDVHWSTVLILFYRAAGHVAGAGSYLPYMGVTLAVDLLALHLLWRVLLRCGVDAWVATLAAAALMVLGAGWEALYWVLILGYTLPLALTFGAALLADRDRLRARHRIGIALLALVSVMCTGAGVAMVVVPFVVVALRRGVRDAFAVVAPAVLVYAVWLAVVGSGILDHPGGASRGMATQVVGFVWQGLAGSVATLFGPFVAGTVGLVALIAWLAARWRRAGMPAPVPACALGAVALFVLTALGRANGGDATLPHYVSTGIALLMPAVALAITDLLRARWLPRLVVCAGLTVVIAHSATDLVRAAHTAAAEDQRSRGILLAAAAISEHDEVLADSYPEPFLAWAVSAADIERLRDRGDFRPPATIPPSLAAEVTLRLHVAIAAHLPPGVGGAACTTTLRTEQHTFTVPVHFDDRGALRITPQTAIELVPYLRGDPGAPSDEVQNTLFLAPGDTRYLVVIQPGTTVLLRFSAGTVALC